MKGVNTGFGGSADTRTGDVEELQKNLLRMLQFGIISNRKPVKTNLLMRQNESLGEIISRSTFPLDDPVSATSMPESWVRASILIRLNSLASGVSGVKESTIRTLHQILGCGIIPQVPIKGSISASGDLSPLSYIGGVIQGKPGLNVWVRGADGEQILKRADVALAEKSIKPVLLGAKEGLALVNGTAVSAAVGSLALHDALGQAALSQVLTAMSVEALCGTDESFDSFFGEVRPHPGQIEVAQNIHAFLARSALVQHHDNSEDGELRQDRYAVRTASQWIGPVLDDLHLAYQQIIIEINSATDNPLVNPREGGKMMHGGNFQAKAVTSAMEKTRQSLQTIGRMLFAQCTEMINPATNRGLPPNLVAGEPSKSFIWKGTDIMIAALQAELGFLANPVGTHVMTAEMGNQAINSLALISARYTLEAVQTLSQLSAAHLVAVCQALDIRAMNLGFIETFAPVFNAMVEEAFKNYLPSGQTIEPLQLSLWIAFQKALDNLTSLDSSKRFFVATESLQPLVLKSLVPSAGSVSALYVWTDLCSSKSFEIFSMNRQAYTANPDASQYLGVASCRMYRFLRDNLGVPFIDNETITTPLHENSEFDWGVEEAKQETTKGVTMGDMICKVFESMRNGEIYHTVMDCISDANTNTILAHKNFNEINDSVSYQSSIEKAETLEAGSSSTPHSETTSGNDSFVPFSPQQVANSGATTPLNKDDPLDSLKTDDSNIVPEPY